ncbi:Signal transduction histidine-protein kinase BarA [Novipirellula aureliae]|uniref:histidine kinase n=1 Tax=Novipirellula aureliae TaxID=2527966 RepID=A0A5C6DJC7_9BACT|nr:response regulator [Novipirellula aureliae]TWU36702.1 Signal transduction histidine-protein kinase BarA [Novipirellula aureliae]
MSENSGFLNRVFANARSTYQALADALPVSLVVKDLEGRRLFANKQYLALVDRAIEDILDKDDFDLFPVEEATGYVADDQVVIRDGKTLHSVIEVMFADQKLHWIEKFKCPIFDEQHQVIGIQVMFWDVTDRVRANEKLRDEQRLLNTLLSNIPDSIYFKDTESRFLRISRAMSKKFGMLSEDGVIGKTDADIFTSEHAKAARDDELRIMQTGVPLVDRVERETWPDQEDSFAMTTKMPLRDEADNIIGTFGLSRDVTELMKSQEALREARDAATKANEAKSNFLANMSHEIRTPMNAIIGMSELLAMTDLTPEQRDYNRLVSDSADSLLRLLNEILDFSKIEANRLELEEIPFSIRDVIEKSGQTLALRASEKSLELLCRVAPEVPDQFVGDPGRLRQIFVNLIGNAVKFTEQGSVFVDVNVADPLEADLSDAEYREHASSSQEIFFLKFVVSDTGIGIPAEKRDAVLEAFTQVDSSTTRQFGGTGLGLTISRQLVDLMGGNLVLESEVGKGTTFQFVLPMKVSETQHVPDGELKVLKGTRVLVVDDNEVNRRILKEIFTNWGFDVQLVASGKEALHCYEMANQTAKPFQLAILDCMMPEMDGFQLAEAIRDNYPNNVTKMIMLSSAGCHHERSVWKSLGIARYLAKPVVQSELLDTIVHVLEANRSSKIDQISPEIAECKPLHVLVAEDGLANQQVAIGMLSACGHTAAIAKDGAEAVTRWQAEPFDIILMDMHMPVLDGIEATLEIRKQERQKGGHSRIPIIALTAAAMQEDVNACQRCGMDGYLSKPVHARKLQEMLNTHAPPVTVKEQLGAEQMKRMDATDAAVHVGESENKLNDIDVDAKDIVDLQAAEEQLPGGRAGLVKLASVFIAECESLMKKLQALVPDGDLGELQRAAHTLKGSSDLFLAKQVCETSRLIETAAKESNRNDLTSLFETLKPQVNAMLRVLRKVTADVQS